GMSRLFWIELGGTGRMAIMARPRADDWLEEEVYAWRHAGIDVVVSLLQRDEVAELGLQREAEFCRSNGSDFVSFPIADRSVPDTHAASQMALGGLHARGSCDRDPLPRGHRAILDDGGVRADPFRLRSRRGARTDQIHPRPERAGHRRAARLGGCLRQRRSTH